jgi:hypothetical protein
MKKAFIIMLLTVATLAAKAQAGKGISLSVGPEFNIPLNTAIYNYGDMRNYYNDGVSGTIKLEAPATSNWHFVLSAGFAWYANAQKYLIVPLNSTEYQAGGYSNFFPTKPYEYLPLRAGLRYYFTRYFYIDGEAGAAVAANSNSVSSFIYSGSAGFIIPFTAKSGLDFNFGYGHGYKITNYDFSMSQLSMGVAYKFGL